MRDQLKSSECSKYLKALADAERLKLIQCLQSGPKPVGELTRALNKPMANVSHHLGLLRSAGILTSRKKGRFVIYGLAPKFLRQASKSPLNVLDFGCCRLELGEKLVPPATRGAAPAK
jgi:ArsR family transcriptional regulator